MSSRTRTAPLAKAPPGRTDFPKATLSQIAKPPNQRKRAAALPAARVSVKRGDGRFCSSRCRDGYDCGLPAHDEHYVRHLTALAEKAAARTTIHKAKFRRKNASKNNRLQRHFAEARVQP